MSALDDLIVSYGFVHAQQANNNNVLSQSQASQQKESPLIKVLKSSSDDVILSYIEKRCNTGKDPVEYLRALLSAVSSRDYEDGPKLRKGIVTKVLSLLEGGKLKDKKATDVIAMLMNEVGFS